MINLSGEGKQKEKSAYRPYKEESSSMKIAVICFTINGYLLAERIAEIISENGDEVSVFTKSRWLEDSGGIPVMGFLHDWIGDMFETKDAVIFIGAAGICVRTIAPYLKSKVHDPAVIVFDELGKYGIPVLSGHLGGANALAKELCEKLGAQPVITTATDINECFSVDVFAKNNNLKISDMNLAKAVSARLLAGGEVGFKSELPVNGTLPAGLNADDPDLPLGIYIGIYTGKSPYKETLYLTPKILCAGVGCKKNIQAKAIDALFEETALKENINPASLCAASSIDLKKDEEGIQEFCKNKGVRFYTYTAGELNALPGEFTSSEFVRLITTVDNVCERAALKLSGGGRLISRKNAKDGVTMAFSVKNKEIFFE